MLLDTWVHFRYLKYWRQHEHHKEAALNPDEQKEKERQDKEDMRIWLQAGNHDSQLSPCTPDL